LRDGRFRRNVDDADDLHLATGHAQPRARTRADDPEGIREPPAHHGHGKARSL
jgi:hypothetical protein